jgi:peptidyl-prolyl cis-trans isomerase C
MTPGKLVKPFADAMVALKNGEITQTPVKSEFGYHVIKLEESRPPSSHRSRKSKAKSPKASNSARSWPTAKNC